MSEENKNNSNNGEDILTDHQYDGIREFDNPLPMWWLVTFFGTIIFAFIYFIHYEFGGGPTLKVELSDALNQIEKMQKQHQKAAPVVEVSEEALADKGKDPAVLNAGAEIFKSKCASCHGENLQGLIGPNLTDNFWIHGKGQRVDILNVVKTGVGEKGMPPWQGILKENEIVAVANFIFSKNGSNPANPKAPQGEKVQ